MMIVLYRSACEWMVRVEVDTFFTAEWMVRVEVKVSCSRLVFHRVLP